MLKLSGFSFSLLIFLYSLANTLVLPLGNVTSASPYLNLNGSLALNEGHNFPIPGTSLTLHLTLLPPQTPLPIETTLLCLHTFAKTFSSGPPTYSLDRMHIQTTLNVKALIAPVRCPSCGLNYRETAKLLAGLWYYTSREKLLYAQRYGVFRSTTGTMVAWGALLTEPVAPGLVGDGDMVLTSPSGVAETS